MTTYKEWLGGRAPDDGNLREYMATIASEYWNSEFKAAEVGAKFEVLKTVAAMANARGGEVFLGVKDDRELVGTMMKSDQLTQVLKQEGAKPGTWYAVDLNQPVRSCISVSLKPHGRTVHVLEVQPAGVPVYVWHSDRSLNLYVRRGASSELLNSFTALEWSRSVTRENLLRTCFLEFEILAQRLQLNINLRPDMGLPGGAFGSALPYLIRRMEDGTLYTCLTQEDLVNLLGKSNPDGSNSPGFLSRFLSLEAEVHRAFRRLEDRGVDPFNSWDQVYQQLNSQFSMISSDVDGFRRYLQNQGISVQ